jgi:hypothetical protein
LHSELIGEVKSQRASVLNGRVNVAVRVRDGSVLLSSDMFRGHFRAVGELFFVVLSGAEETRMKLHLNRMQLLVAGLCKNTYTVSAVVKRYTDVFFALEKVLAGFDVAPEQFNQKTTDFPLYAPFAPPKGGIAPSASLLPLMLVEPPRAEMRCSPEHMHRALRVAAEHLAKLDDDRAAAAASATVGVADICRPPPDDAADTPPMIEFVAQPSFPLPAKRLRRLSWPPEPQRRESAATASSSPSSSSSSSSAAAVAARSTPPPVSPRKPANGGAAVPPRPPRLGPARPTRPIRRSTASGAMTVSDRMSAFQ